MPNPIADQNILLGVTGSIAAYKAVDIASKLTQAGAKVDVILTESACHFISPLTFQSVTGRKAFTDANLWDGEGHVTHIGLGRSGDLYVIAPASANTIGKLANGIADNLLTIAALAARCPVLISPAMDAGMYNHPAMQANVATLKQRGVHFFGPVSGHLASGLVGLGRMVEPVDLVREIQYLVSRKGPMAGKKVVVTAGGTEEAIDPVRVITNRSSGKQGFAVAQAALDSGAEVVLIHTSTHLEIPPNVKSVAVKTAAEMKSAVLAEIPQADALIMAAAVSDFRPIQTAANKIKKTGKHLILELEPTDDILLAVANERKVSGFPRRVIGFAAESQDLLNNAQTKLSAKSMDLIVANDISSGDAGFEVDNNRVTLIFAKGQFFSLPLMSKTQVAERILEELIPLLA